MSSDTTTATLLVFTLGPEADSRRRPVLPPQLRPLERELRSRCLDDILNAGRSCGLDLVVATDSPLDLADDVRYHEQRGNGFASRLASAVSRVEAARPKRPLVLVGADLPGFSRSHLRAALDRLAAEPTAVVVGPSPDGGVYLVAAAGRIAPILGRVDWCRKHTCSHLVGLLAAAGRRVLFLPTLADLDRPSDISRLLASDRSRVLGTHLLGRLLAALRRICRAFVPDETCRPQVAPIWVQPRRGPPA